jgi:transcriptional regulator with XRE-family HTH domain
MNWQPALGAALRLLRIRRDLSQTRVAAASGITKAMISSFETGKQIPSLNSLGAILRALESDLRDLQAILDHVEPSLFGLTDAKRVRAQAVEDLSRQFHEMSRVFQNIGSTLEVLEHPLPLPPQGVRAARSGEHRD